MHSYTIHGFKLFPIITKNILVFYTILVGICFTVTLLEQLWTILKNQNQHF